MWGFRQLAYIEPVLPEEMIQFLLPAADPVGIPAIQPQDFSPLRPSRPCCHIRLQRRRRFWAQPV